MGVEEVLNDAFDRALDYQKAMKENPNTRRDLELDALVEILNKNVLLLVTLMYSLKLLI